MATKRVFEVTRSASLDANRRTKYFINAVFIMIALWQIPFLVDYRDYPIILDIYQKLKGPGAILFIIITAAIFYTMRSSRDRPSTIRLEEGGIRPSWGSRKLFFPKGRARFHPWMPAQMNTAQGACMELWCGRRSFIVGASGVSMIDLIMDAPPKRAVDCEVSSSVFLKIAEGLFMAPPDPGATTPHRDISLAASSARNFRWVKDTRLWVLVICAFCVFLPVLMDPDTALEWGWLQIVGVLGGMGFFFNIKITPKAKDPTPVLRISENGLQYRDPNGHLLADAPFSQIKATKLSYRYNKINRFVVERHSLAVLKLSFPDKTLFLSCPFGRKSWNETTELCGPPQYDIAAYNWDELLSVLAAQLQGASREA